jgi:membrane protein required for colicin V production
MAGIGWVDLFVIAVVLLSVLLGVLRGLVHEVMSVFGWLVAWLAAQAWAAPVGLKVVWVPMSPMARQALGFVLCFVVVLFAWRLLAWLISQVLKATPLAPVDRLLGGVFGILRAALIVLVLVTLAGLTPLVRQPFWAESRAVTATLWLLAGITPLLPKDWTTPARGAARG